MSDTPTRQAPLEWFGWTVVGVVARMVLLK